MLAIGPDLRGGGALGRLSDGPGIELLRAAGGSDGLRVFYESRPDLVVLDLELPDADGFDVLATTRALSDVPVLALTGEREAGRIAALRGGADDCISKPPSGAELMARVEALLRRPRRGDPGPAVLADEHVEIDLARHRVAVHGVEVELTPTEFRMLTAFAQNPGRALGHGRLLELVWGDRIRGREEVKLYVSYLRRKLGEAAGVDPVETVRGVGYRYRPRLAGTDDGDGSAAGGS